MNAPPIREPWTTDKTGRLVSIPWLLWLQQLTTDPIPAHVAEADPHEQYTLETMFDDHSARHENGGADEISVAGLSGELADLQPPKSHGAAAHTGMIGTEAQITFDLVAGHDHDGVDSKLIIAGSGYAKTFLLMGG